MLETIEEPDSALPSGGFFLKDRVDESLIDEFSRFICETSWTRQETMHIGLCPRSSHGPFHLTEHPLLWEVDNQARYRFSVLPGIWNRSDLLFYLRPRDTAPAFEETSHFRGRRTRKRVLTVNRHVFRLDGRQIYPFDASGILRGKWVKEHVVELFARHGIAIDLAKRGFYDPTAAASSLNSARLRVLGSKIRKWLRPPLKRLHAVLNEPLDRFRY